MSGILFRFWLRRFSLVFAISGVALSLVERLAHEDDSNFLSPIAWAAAAGFVAASVATYWARKHGCALPRNTQ